MIRDDAEKLAASLQAALGEASGVTATSSARDKRVEFAAPGGGRPHIIRYSIRIADGSRATHLTLDDAEDFLPVVVPGWGADAVFQALAARGFAVVPAVDTVEGPQERQEGEWEPQDQAGTGP